MPFRVPAARLQVSMHCCQQHVSTGQVNPPLKFPTVAQPDVRTMIGAVMVATTVLFGAIARFEGRLISERTKDGLLAVRKRGRTPGRLPLHADKVSAPQELLKTESS